jgi:hypothetical protein
MSEADAVVSIVTSEQALQHVRLPRSSLAAAVVCKRRGYIVGLC